MLPQRNPREPIEVDIDLEDLAPPRSGGGGRAAPRGRRVYRLRDAAGLLAAFALTLLVLDADGLHAWVTRMDVGPAQDFWASLVEPWRRVAAQAGLTAPRRAALRAADALAASVAGAGGNEDLLARGWTPDAAAEPAIPPPPSPSTPPPSPTLTPGGAAAVAAVSAAPPPASAPSPAEARPPRPASTGAPASLLLLGDSLMVTLSPSIVRAFEKDPAVNVIVADRSATGLSRPDVYDWPTVAASFVATHQPRLVVCSFGGNDAQDVRAPDGKVLRFGSEAWDALYTERVRALMDMLQQSGAEVLWLGLPPMRGRVFDGKMRHLNELFALQATSGAGITFEGTGALVGDKEGRFAEYTRTSRGRLLRVRTADGIHYGDEGGRRVAERVKGWVADRLGARTSAAAPLPSPDAH